MRAYELAVEMYESEDSLNRVIAKCAKVGGVFIDNDCLICGYPTNSSFIDDSSEESVDFADTWYIYIAVGDMKKAFEAFSPKKFIAFERFDGKQRLHSFDKIRRLIWAHQTHRTFQILSQKWQR